MLEARGMTSHLGASGRCHIDHGRSRETERPLSKFHIPAALFLVAVAASVLFLDVPLALYFRSISDSVLVSIAGAITDAGLGHWFLGGAVIAGILAALRKRRDVVDMAVFMFGAVAVSGIIVNLLKIIAGRTRPKLLLNEETHGFFFFRIGHDYASFPSGHATTLAAASMALALIFPAWRVPILATGIVLALTRVAVTAHYLSDVVAGIALGIVCTLALHAWLKARHARRGSGI